MVTRATLPTNLVTAPATTFHTFNTTSGLNLSALNGGSATISTEISRSSTSTLKCVSNGASLMEVRKTAAFSMPGRKMGIWVYVPDYTAISSFLLYVGSSGFAAFSNFTYSFASTDKQYNGWHFIDTQPDNWTGGTPTDFTIAQADFKIRITPAGASGCTCYFDVIEYGYRNRTKALVSFDDGYASAWTDSNGIAYANSLGIRCSLGIIAEQIDSVATWLTSSELAAVYAAGNDLLPHGATSLGTIKLYPAIVADLKTNRNFLADRGYTRGVNHYIYPNGVYQIAAGDPTIANALTEVGITGFARGTSTPITFPTRIGNGNLKLLPIIGLSAGESPSTILTRVDAAIARGQSFCLMFHDVIAGATSGISVNSTDLKTIFDGLSTRMKQGLLDCETYSSFYNKIYGRHAEL